MDIGSVMTREVAVVRPDSSVQEAAQVMKRLNVGSVPVCTGRKLVGMLTDRDITIRAVAEGRDPRQTRAEEVMTPDVVYAYEDQSVEEVADTMSAHQIRRMPIISRNKELVGIVALGDLAVDVQDDQMSGDVLEDVSEPARPQRRGRAGSETSSRTSPLIWSSWTSTAKSPSATMPTSSLLRLMIGIRRIWCADMVSATSSTLWSS
jgi:CBS domain-containing protein